MTSKQAIGLGCGIAALLLVAGIAAVIGFFVYASQDVKGVTVSVEGPGDVRVGDTFDLEVLVTNDRPRAAVKLSDVDLADAYLAGFTVLSVDPEAKSSMHVPFDNSWSYTFDVVIPVGETRSFTFTLRAEKTGLFRGDVDVCEGMRFISAMAQTMVREQR